MISMAIAKIHPIKSTLNLAIDYITKSGRRYFLYLDKLLF